MLICQAIQNDMAIATVDEAVRAYPVNLLKLWQAAKKGDRHADTSELEKAINNLVYKLYIIHPFSFTEAEYKAIKVK